MVIEVTHTTGTSGLQGCACIHTHVQSALRLPCVPHEGGLAQFEAPAAEVPEAGPFADEPCTAH